MRRDLTFVIECVTTEDIREPSWGIQFFELLCDFGFVPKTIGNWEPIRTPFAWEAIPDVWSKSSIIARGHSPTRFSAMVTWTRRPYAHSAKCNFASLDASWHSLDPTTALELARQLLLWSRGLHAVVCTRSAFYQQSLRRTGKNPPGMLPGVFWANLFGPAYGNVVSWRDVVIPDADILVSPEGISSVVFRRPIDDPVFEDPGSSLLSTAKTQIGTRLFLDSSDPIILPQLVTGQPSWP